MGPTHQAIRRHAPISACVRVDGSGVADIQGRKIAGNFTGHARHFESMFRDGNSYSDWSLNRSFRHPAPILFFVVDGLVMLAMRVAQNADAAPCGYPCDRDTDHEIGPVAAKPPHQAAGDEDTAVRREIV